MQLDGPGLAPLSGGKTAQLVVLLHGVAANGNDLLYLARAWQKLLPEAEFIAPHAPFPCDYAPEGWQWFSLQDRAPEKLLAGLRNAAAILDNFFDELLASRGLDESQLALAGFSQGAATALYAGLHRQKQIAGIVAFSGALPWGRRCKARLPANRRFSPCMVRRTRSCLSHRWSLRRPCSKLRASRSRRWQGLALAILSTRRE